MPVTHNDYMRELQERATFEREREQKRAAIYPRRPAPVRPAVPEPERFTEGDVEAILADFDMLTADVAEPAHDDDAASILRILDLDVLWPVSEPKNVGTPRSTIIEEGLELARRSRACLGSAEGGASVPLVGDPTTPLPASDAPELPTPSPSSITLTPANDDGTAWEDLSEHRKITLAIEEASAFGVPRAFTLNLSPDVIEAALNDNQRTFSGHVLKRLQEELGKRVGRRPVIVATDRTRSGRYHVHGVVVGNSVEELEGPIAAAAQAAAGEWGKKHGRRYQVDQRSIWDGAGWARYLLKLRDRRWIKAGGATGRTWSITRELTRAAREAHKARRSPSKHTRRKSPPFRPIPITRPLPLPVPVLLTAESIRRTIPESRSVLPRARTIPTTPGLIFYKALPALDHIPGAPHHVPGVPSVLTYRPRGPPRSALPCHAAASTKPAPHDAAQQPPSRGHPCSARPSPHRASRTFMTSSRKPSTTPTGSRAGTRRSAA